MQSAMDLWFSVGNELMMRRFPLAIASAPALVAVVGCVSAALLAGCGGSQPLIGTPGTMPQSARIARRAAEGNLIYVLGGTRAYVLSYADGTVVNKFDNPGAWWGLCSDRYGNVFIPAKDRVLKYKHGNTVPTTKLNNAKEYSTGCSVDVATGNLAVANYDPKGSGPRNNIAIYSGATGKPTLLRHHSMKSYFACVYDNDGNLFVDGEGLNGETSLAELPAGSRNFHKLTLNTQLSLGQLQWDGQYLAVIGGERYVYQLQISGSSAKAVNKIVLYSHVKLHRTFWLKGSSLLSPTGTDHSIVGVWSYPRGGKTVKEYSTERKADLGGITVSTAPH